MKDASVNVCSCEQSPSTRKGFLCSWPTSVVSSSCSSAAQDKTELQNGFKIETFLIGQPLC